MEQFTEFVCLFEVETLFTDVFFLFREKKKKKKKKDSGKYRHNFMYSELIPIQLNQNPENMIQEITLLQTN